MSHGLGTASGVLLGLCLLVHPDFVLVVGPCLAFVAWRHRDRLLRVAVVFALVAAPWFLFATAYYGSPVPATITAKANRYVAVPGLTASPGAWFEFASDQVAAQTNFWRIAAPFKENGFVVDAPVADPVLVAISTGVFGLALAGAWLLRRRPALWPAVAFCGLFVAYKVLLLPNVYYEWYLPPVMAIVVLLAAVALQRLAVRVPSGAPAVAAVLAVAFAAHIPFSFPLERRVQYAIEDRVRLEMGRWLRANVGSTETVASESAGYVGYYGRVKLFDFPGLTSPTVLEALAEHEEHRSLVGMIHLLRPDWAVLRPFELDMLKAAHPDAAASYTEVRRFAVDEADTGLRLGPVEYYNIDRQFVVLRRTSGSSGPNP